MEPGILIKDLILHLLPFMDLQSVANFSATCEHFSHTIWAIASDPNPPIVALVFSKLASARIGCGRPVFGYAAVYVDVMVEFMRIVHREFVKEEAEEEEEEEEDAEEKEEKEARCREADVYVALCLEQMYRHAYYRYGYSPVKLLKQRAQKFSSSPHPPTPDFNPVLLPNCATTIRAFGGALRFRRDKSENEVCLFGAYPRKYAVMSIPRSGPSRSKLMVQRVATILQESPDAKLSDLLEEDED